MQDATDQTELTRLRMAVAATGDVVYDWDLQAGVLHWSETAPPVRALEDPAGTTALRAYQARMAPDDAPLRALTLSRHLQQRQAFACSYKIRRDDGGHEWVEERAVVHCDADGEPIRMVGVLRAFTDAKSLEERLQLLAYRDELSGRLNRARMTEVVRSAITRTRSRTRRQKSARRSGVAAGPAATSPAHSRSTIGSTASSRARNPAGPSRRVRLSGPSPSGRATKRSERPGVSIGSARSQARAAARWPALSPSKHTTGSGTIFHSSAIWSSVKAVPSGATVWRKPARCSAITSM